MAQRHAFSGNAVARTIAAAPATRSRLSARLPRLLLVLAALCTPSCARAADKPQEPATVNAAARLLDVRTLKLPDGAKPGGIYTMAILMYETPGTPRAAFQWQRAQLVAMGWKELPGTYLVDTSASAHLRKDGFIVALSASQAGSDPAQAARASVTVVNHGNVDTAGLPVPPGAKPFYSSPSQASYLTEAGVPETADACRKLLLAAGWKPYGTASADPQSPMMYFKRNAIRIMAWISTAPAQDNKTTIHYSADLLSADLPVPPDAPDPRYSDIDKTLRFDYPGEDIGPIVDFYRGQLAEQGWQPTTDKPIVDDQKQTAFLVFRNASRELLSLDLAHFTDIVRVTVSHQTAAELADAERLAKEAAARERAEMARQAERDKKIILRVPLPPGAGEVEQVSPSVFEFKVGKKQGPAALRTLREHFLAEDWTEQGQSKFDEHHGSVELRRGEERLDMSYITTGVTPTEIRVSSSSKFELAPQLTTAEAPAPDEAPQTAKKSPPSAVPGVPDLLEGVDLSDVPEAAEVLKSIEKAVGKRPAAAQGSKRAAKPGPNKGAAAAVVKVADLPIPPDATGVEYSKTTKMIDVHSPADVETVAGFFVAALIDRGWEKTSRGIVSAETGILKFSRGEANLTFFLHGRDDGTDVKLVTKGLSWDVVPPSKVAAKTKARPRQPSAAKPERQSDSPGSPAPPDEPLADAAPRVAAQKVSVPEQKQASAALWVDDKKYPLAYGVAFQAARDGKTNTEVLLSVKPIAADKIAPLVNQGKDGGDVLRFDPQLKLRFDEAGKLDYLFLYADGLSVNLGGPGPDVVTAEIAVADGRARGQAIMVKPGALFKQQYRFEAIFDCKLATAPAGADEPEAGTPDPAELVADDEAGLPIPHGATSRSSTKTAFRRSVTAQVPEALPAVVAFYRREFPARGWREKPGAAKVAPDRAELAFAGAEGDVSVTIERQGQEVGVNLVTRDPAKARAGGIEPQANRARLILGNGGAREAALSINGSPYKVAAGRGAKDPKDGMSLHVLPGKYTVTLKTSGGADQSQELRVEAGETWGVVVLPTGAFFADRLY